MEEKFTPILYQRINSKENALKVIKYVSIGFFILAGIDVVLTPFFQLERVLDALIYIVLASWLIKWKSRIASVLLLLVCLTSFSGLIYLSLDDPMHRLYFIPNIFILWAAIRVLEATFKYQGKYSVNET
jgi:hypothetical protein